MVNLRRAIRALFTQPPQPRALDRRIADELASLQHRADVDRLLCRQGQRSACR
ncbi:hypothetical protein ACOXXX_12935 [Thalassococcus sp. BH17M4-6]|uniref:hypothetical protein n=1 Tax=Thalassococcus sp. BH17M4-6 TaxID=3413148 RepID=UPI003BBC5E3D